MYDRILVPLDGSPLAEQVLPYVHVIGSGLQCPIILFRAFEVPQEMADPGHGLYVDQVATSFRQQAHEYLMRVSATLTDLRTNLSLVEKEGEPGSGIVAEAENVPGTLVAISTHGRSGVTRWVMGSIADKVLRATNNPMLLIRARPIEGFSPQAIATRSERWASYVNIKSITLPLDGSSLSEQVIPHAVAIAKTLNVAVTPVGVAATPEDNAQTNEYLNKANEQLRQEGVAANGAQLLHGNPAVAILDMTQRTPDTLVAMTTRGLSGVERWVMGSVTDRVVRYSGTPVLVVRAA